MYIFLFFIFRVIVQNTVTGANHPARKLKRRVTGQRPHQKMQRIYDKRGDWSFLSFLCVTLFCVATSDIEKELTCLKRCWWFTIWYLHSHFLRQQDLPHIFSLHHHHHHQFLSCQVLHSEKDFHSSLLFGKLFLQSSFST